MSRLDDIRNAARQEPQGNILNGPQPKGIVREPYVAFSAPTGDPQIRVILYAKKYFMMPQYAAIVDVFFDGRGEFIGLVLPHHQVRMFGKNLLPIVAALRTNTVEWIREWDSFYLPMEDPEASVVESIETDAVRNPFEAEKRPTI